jgi:serine protease Do
MVAAPALHADNERETPIVKAIRRAGASCVDIHTEKTSASGSAVYSSSQPQARKINGMGSGVVVDERGYIVTNYHVIADVEVIRVSFLDGADFAATVVGYDRDQDLALIKVETHKPLTVMYTGTSSDLMLGESVIAIGNAFGYDHTCTSGIISALHRDVEVNETQSYRNLIQIDTAINPGNSGGPLLNMKGELIGINVAIRAGAQRIGFAIPIDDARKVIARMISVEQLSQTQHGLLTRDLKNGTVRKLVIEGLRPETPAAQAGIQPGDIVLKVADREIVDGVDFERALLGRPAGEKVSVTVSRGDKTESLAITLTPYLAGRAKLSPQYVARANNETDNDRFWRMLGVKLGSLSGDRRTQVPAPYAGGLVVTDVKADSPAASNGIKKDDILVGLLEFETKSHFDVNWVLNQPMPPEKSMSFRVVRGQQVLFGHVIPISDILAQSPAAKTIK